MSLGDLAGSRVTLVYPAGATTQGERPTRQGLPRGEDLVALEERTSGLVHDLKNILNSVGLYLELIQRSVASGGNTERVQSHIDVMKQELARGGQYLDRVREPGRERCECPAEKIDLNDLVREACDATRPLGSAAHRVHEELGNPVPFVGYASDIVSALVNLVVNALHAIALGGSVTVRTGQAQDRAWVQVADDGPGMPLEVERRAFEPFFTTKGEMGTGLGLAMVRTCMQRHSGSVKLDTSVGNGTTLTLIFPAVGRELTNEIGPRK